jgi:hypothetical protein
VLHDGSDEVIGAFPEAPGQLAPTVRDGADQGNKVYGKLKRVGSHHQPRYERDTTEELAAALGKKPFTVREHWCNAGRIECEKDANGTSLKRSHSFSSTP